MNRGILYEDGFRPQFSGHETFPLRYGWLKKAFDAVYELEQAELQEQAKDVFLKDDAIARFGVGKNMVGSMRHWATSAHVLREDEDKNIVTTDLAKLLLTSNGLDPWMENTSSIWIFHWHIATNSSKATYIWLFNHFHSHQFDRNFVAQSVLEISKERGWKAGSAATLKRDVECLVRAYVSKPSKNQEFTEEQIESPLAELGIIQPVSRNETFQISRGYQSSLGNGAFLYALLDFWEKYAGEARTLSLESICYEPGSPGRVLCLDEDAVADRLYGIEKISDGLLAWSETAGLRQVIAQKSLKGVEKLGFLSLDYQETTKRKVA